jgi:hypothetical protein
MRPLNRSRGKHPTPESSLRSTDASGKPTGTRIPTENVRHALRTSRARPSSEPTPAPRPWNRRGESTQPVPVDARCSSWPGCRAGHIRPASERSRRVHRRGPARSNVRESSAPFHVGTGATRQVVKDRATVRLGPREPERDHAAPRPTLNGRFTTSCPTYPTRNHRAPVFVRKGVSDPQPLPGESRRRPVGCAVARGSRRKPDTSPTRPDGQSVGSSPSGVERHARRGLPYRPFADGSGKPESGEGTRSR